MNRSPRVKWVEQKVHALFSDGMVLDVGYVGIYAEPFLHLSLRAQNPSLQLIGLDIDRKNVLYHQLSYTVVGDAKVLPFRPGVFDGVLFLEVIEHIYCPEVALKEFWRVLRPGGKLIITTPNSWSWWSVIRHWVLGNLSTKTNKQNYKNYLGAPDHIRFYDPLSLMNILDQQGFRVLEIQTKNHALPFFGRYIRILSRLDLRFWPMNRFGHYICIVAEKDR